MNPVRKCLKLDSVTQDALLHPAAFGGGATDEEEELLWVEEDTTDSSLIITMDETRARPRKRRKKPTDEDSGGGASESEPEIDRHLNQSLETKSRQHNLTAVNVKNILHEVITNEHVVAMMKAAINDTEAVPPFEPKMTRSKLKEVVEKGVVIPAWNLSPIKKHNVVNKPPQFVDMTLADEDSSDEEYRPDDEEEDETAEDTFQESDLESTASSPRGSRLRDESCSPWQVPLSRRVRAESVSMGPPPPPKAASTRSLSDSSRTPSTRGLFDSGRGRRSVSDCTFLEKLHAVEEELSIYMEPYQHLQDPEVDLMAARTRSKRPLRDVPLGRLEAELKAPDITPDMYDCEAFPQDEDRDWTDWLRGLMSSDIEEEADDEDDPEYNFLADIDEPDLEDYRDDRAVRITKKEVSELMEELFETLKEDLAQDPDDEEEEMASENHTHQQDSAETGHSDPVPVHELRTVRQQLEFIRSHHKRTTALDFTESESLSLNVSQRARLKQQLQQYVQLLTQIHLLSAPVASLQTETQTTMQFLVELDFLAQRAELMCRRVSAFRACNLQGALQLLQETTTHPIKYSPPRPGNRGRNQSLTVLPAELAWIFATRSVFLYPELLPCVNLDPELYCPRRTAAFTAAEDCLLVLGLRHLEGSSDPVRLVSELVLRKSLVQVRRRILECCRPGNGDNMVKAFRFHRVLWPMPSACSPQTELRPPVEREERGMPMWLIRSLPVLHAFMLRSHSDVTASCSHLLSRTSHLTHLRSPWSGPFPAKTRFPLRLPKDQLDFRRIGFILLHPSAENRTKTGYDHPRTGIGPSTEDETEEEAKEEECDVVLTLSESPSSSNRDSESDTDSHEPQGQTDTETKQNCISHEPLRPGSDVREGPKMEAAVVGAKNICVRNGKKTVVWTRESDRVLLMAVKHRGANRKTFRDVSLQLGDKSTAQVGLRFRDLMTLFHSSNHRTSSCSSQEPISMQEAPD